MPPGVLATVPKPWAASCCQGCHGVATKGPPPYTSWNHSDAGPTTAGCSNGITTPHRDYSYASSWPHNFHTSSVPGTAVGLSTTLISTRVAGWRFAAVAARRAHGHRKFNGSSRKSSVCYASQLLISVPIGAFWHFVRT